jgi:hypothetical protein
VGASGSKVTEKEIAMLNLCTPAQIEQLKRDAKRLVRDKSLTHAAALDQIATSQGYSNWSLLVRNVTRRQIGVVPSRPKIQLHRLIRTTEAMRQAMRKTIPTPGIGSSHDRLRAQIDDLSQLFISATNALDFAISYLECALSVARFSIHSHSIAYYEMRCWLPYCVHVVKDDSYLLLGRDYKPVGMVQKKNHVDYAAFTQVHLSITPQQLRQQVMVYREDGAEGYFYDASPWASRRHAESYLEHLRKLRNWLS